MQYDALLEMYGQKVSKIFNLNMSLTIIVEYFFSLG